MFNKRGNPVQIDIRIDYLHFSKTYDHQIWQAGTSFFFNWDSLHARLISHYKAWGYKKKKHKKIKANRKSV